MGPSHIFILKLKLRRKSFQFLGYRSSQSYQVIFQLFKCKDGGVSAAQKGFTHMNVITHHEKQSSTTQSFILQQWACTHSWAELSEKQIRTVCNATLGELQFIQNDGAFCFHYDMMREDSFVQMISANLQVSNTSVLKF